MKLTVSYEEVAALVAQKTGQQIALSYVEPDTVQANVAVRLPLVGTTWLGLQLTVVSIIGDELHVRAASGMLSKLLKLLPAKEIARWADIKGDTVTIYLARIPALDNVLRTLEPQTLLFTPEGAELEAALRC